MTTCLRYLSDIDTWRASGRFVYGKHLASSILWQSIAAPSTSRTYIFCTGPTTPSCGRALRVRSRAGSCLLPRVPSPFLRSPSVPDSYCCPGSCFPAALESSQLQADRLCTPAARLRMSFALPACSWLGSAQACLLPSENSDRHQRLTRRQLRISAGRARAPSLESVDETALYRYAHALKKARSSSAAVLSPIQRKPSRQATSSPPARTEAVITAPEQARQQLQTESESKSQEQTSGNGFVHALKGLLPNWTPRVRGLVLLNLLVLLVATNWVSGGEVYDRIFCK